MLRVKKAALAVFLFIIIMASNMSVTMIKAEEYWPQGPEVSSASAIIMDQETGTILYEKNINERMYPASITKILTTLIAIENSSMDEIVTFSEDAIYKTEGSGIARDVGEQMTMEQCLYAVMLASSNESAYAVGEHVAGGDINVFVEMMNAKALELGCMNTNFSNPNGLPDENHYTTAYDMALISRAAYQNEIFRTICGTKTYTIPFTNKHTDEETYLQNHHAMLYPLRTRQYLYEYCMGGKTGYTTQSNSTLVTYAQKDDLTLICVVMNADSPNHYLDTRGLFDFCFENFQLWNISENDETFQSSTQTVEGFMTEVDPFVALDTTSSIILPLTANFSDAQSEILYDTADTETAARIQYTYGGKVVGSCAVVASGAVAAPFAFKSVSSDTESTASAVTETEAEGDKHVITIDFKKILLVAAIIIAIVLLLFGIYKLIDNFYLIRRRFLGDKKSKSPYKKIRTNRMYKRRNKKDR